MCRPRIVRGRRFWLSQRKRFNAVDRSSSLDSRRRPHVADALREVIYGHHEVGIFALVG